MSKSEKKQPKTFFLNEQHELGHSEKDGGGRPPKYAPINWATKGQVIHQSLSTVKQKIKRSKDPLRENHFFLLANPEKKVVKESESRGEKSTYEEKTEYAKDDSQIFQRLGLDLLQVNDDGTAAVHARSDQIERLLATTEFLNKLNQRDKFKWAKIHEFDLISSKYRIDLPWIENFKPNDKIDTVIEFQPLLENREVETVLNAIVELLKRFEAGKLSRGGKDFSGRHWYRGNITRKCLETIAECFYSVQSLHSPLMAIAAGEKNLVSQKINTKVASQRIDTTQLPCVAVVDTGIPADHLLLSNYRRSGQYIDPAAIGVPQSDHGSFVASRIVFGDCSYDELANSPQGMCTFYDVNIASGGGEIDEKGVYEAMNSIVRMAPDIRVFNFSFDGKIPLENMKITRKEKLRLVQDLDNFIFANDVIVAIAAGNSTKGVIPQQKYPAHLDDPQWGLAHWARSFNSITCGSYVNLSSIGDGLVRDAGWPSPFTRVGPGFCKSPKPDFSAHGGNLTSEYQFVTGLGVWGCNARGIIEDNSGTSYSAPLLAREAAFTLNILNNYCTSGAKPYGVTVKAFLALTAESPVPDTRVSQLVERTLGKGTATSKRINNPRANSAVLIWQGILENSKDKIMVRIPIPKAWLENADKPYLRLVLAGDIPVNSEVVGLWACRKIEAQFRPAPNTPALHPKGSGHISYPLIERGYDLKKIPSGVTVEGDEWLLEISYTEKAAYYSNLDFAPQQRVAFAAELVDFGESSVSPQAYLQELPIASTMQRLSVPPTILRAPIIIKSRM
ncbi:MAG: S8 family serine peptidase [Planctomycetaceae bacterium]|nr:S8 family serine peptidase [Planctomycetaceae bacterium]